MPDSPFIPRSFTRFRFGGVAALAIPRAWLRTLGPLGGAPQIFDPIGQQNRTLAAFVRMPRVFDVRVADVLRDNLSGRLFVVQQVQQTPSRIDLLHCSEIRAPIPDEFNAQSLEAFWAQTVTGFASSSDGPSEPVLLLNSMPAGTLPSAAKGNYQLVSGDFDVWARLKSDVGSVGNVRHPLIGAQHPVTGLGCYVGIRDNGATGELIRLDEYQAATLDTTSGLIAAPATAYFVRLKRTGSRFQTFFKATLDPPVLDSEWIEIFNEPAQSFASTDDLRVGLFGYTNNSTAGQSLWHFLRNWTGQGSPGEAPGNRSAFPTHWLIPNPNTVTLDSRQLGVFIAPDGLEMTFTKSKVVYGGGSHTSGGSVTFAFDHRKAAESWGVSNVFGSISLNNTNSVLGTVYTNDFLDIVLSPNDYVIAFIDLLSGTVSERDVILALIGTQRLQ